MNWSISMASIDELNQLGQTWAGAELRGDTALLDRLLADDFSGVGPYGFMLTKTQWLTRFTSGDLKHDSFTWDDVRVRIYGDAAVVTGRQTMTGTHQGNPVQGQFRVTQLLVKQSGTWQIAALQLSPIMQPPGRP
jgi:ketosteroid isomerase-like protein